VFVKFKKNLNENTLKIYYRKCLTYSRIDLYLDHRLKPRRTHMGTAAVFSVDSEQDGSKRWKKAICMTSDGFPMNLRDIADSYIAEMSANRYFVGNYPQTLYIMNKIIAKDEYLFIDDISNACWISWSAQFNPFTKTITYYEGMFDIAMMKYRYHRKKWVAESLYDNDVLFDVTAESRSRKIVEQIYAKNVDEARQLMMSFHMIAGDYKYTIVEKKVRAKVAA